MVVNTERTLTDLWSTLSHKIIASVLTDHGAAFPAMEVLGHDAKLFPGKDAQIWRAICQCVESDTPPTVEAVGIRIAKDTIEPGYLTTVAAGFNQDDNSRVYYHAQELKRVGLTAQARSIGRELAALVEPDKLGDAIAETEAGLAGLLALQSERQPDALTVSASAWGEVENFDGDGIPTGLKWFDTITGGIWTGFNYWITAAYKQGKTTLMRNIMLNAAKAGHSVGALCAEGSREMFALDCQAMIATDILINQGFPTNQLRVGGLFIRRTWRKQSLLERAELEAIHEARAIWERLPIQVWDTRDNIKDHNTFRHKIKRAKLDYGTRLFFADHSQLFGGNGTIYERQSATARLVQDVASGEDVALWMLSQRNEEAVKYGQKDSYSTGVKGGGDASAAADFELTTAYDHEAHEMTVTLHHSRHTATGKGQHHISAASGLFIDRLFKTDPLSY